MTDRLTFRRTVDFAAEALELEAGSYLLLAIDKSSGEKDCALTLKGDLGDLSEALAQALLESDGMCDVMQGAMDRLSAKVETAGNCKEQTENEPIDEENGKHIDRQGA